MSEEIVEDTTAISGAHLDATVGAAPSGPDEGPSALGIPAFSGLVVANVFSALAFGSSRFVFVWLIGDLTEWNPATAILGILLGLPPLLLSAWAGSHHCDAGKPRQPRYRSNPHDPWRSVAEYRFLSQAKDAW